MKKRIYRFAVVNKGGFIVGRHTTKKLALQNICWEGDHIIPYSKLPKYVRK